MGIIGTIVVGLIVGALARWVMPGEQKMGWIMTILLGIVGSVVAGFIGGALGWYQPGQGAGWIASVLGAMLVLFVVQKLRASKWARRSLAQGDTGRPRSATRPPDSAVVAGCRGPIAMWMAAPNAAPTSWAPTKPSALPGAMPAKLSLSMRPNTAAGFANEVDAVNQ